MTLDDAPDVLTVPEAARLARVGRNAMYQAVARGDIHSVRIGRSVRIPTIALRRFLGMPSELKQVVDEPDFALVGEARHGPSDRPDPSPQPVALDDQAQQLGRQLALVRPLRHDASVAQRTTRRPVASRDGREPDVPVAGPTGPRDRRLTTDTVGRRSTGIGST